MPATTYLRLSELAAQIEDVINDAFYQSTFWVLADVIDYKLHEQKGHHYFCLAEKDKATNSITAKISAAAWKNQGGFSIESFEQITGQKFGSNIHVLANVSVQYTPAYGLKLILNEVDPTYTIGILEQQRRETLERLTASCPDYISLVGDTYYTRNKSLEHSAVIQHIAVVSSSGSEGFRDFKDTIEQNRFGYAIKLDTWFTSVQGEANAQGVCNRLIDIFKSGVPYDAVVIIRGGGSQADLMLFEQFVLARAVAKFPVPIITGIGHHINQSIVDLMAHTSVKTPSIAAEFIIAHNRQFEESILQMQQSIILSTQQVFNERQQDFALLRSVVVNTGRKMLYKHQAFLKNVGNRLVLQPKIIAASKRCDLQAANHDLTSGVRRYLKAQKGYISHQASVNKILNPVNILKRGFAVVYHGDGIVTNADGIAASDKISIRFHHSNISATVISKTNLDGDLANL